MTTESYTKAQCSSSHSFVFFCDVVVVVCVGLCESFENLIKSTFLAFRDQPDTTFAREFVLKGMADSLRFGRRVSDCLIPISPKPNLIQDPV